jgi:hypothetical protein
MDDPLVKYLVLVPLTYNDGSPVAEEIVLKFEEQVFRISGGFTVAGTVRGAYLMMDGKKQIDHSLQYWIWLKEEEYDNLRSIVSELGGQLGQESMYLERAGASLEFVPAPPDEGGTA